MHFSAPVTSGHQVGFTCFTDYLFFRHGCPEVNGIFLLGYLYTNAQPKCKAMDSDPKELEALAKRVYTQSQLIVYQIDNLQH